jgi:hypothetical protein
MAFLRLLEEWLTSIGLADRIAAFRDNGITRDNFAELTENDLRELGLTIGERKRFISGAIKRPDVECDGATTTNGRDPIQGPGPI